VASLESDGRRIYLVMGNPVNRSPFKDAQTQYRAKTTLPTSIYV
jgi:hypothetical protein